MNIKMDTSGFADSIRNKAIEIQAATRPAAQAGAQVIYEAARANAPVSAEAHYFYGTSYKKTGKRYLFTPGTLRNSIYQVYSKSNSGNNQATYHISWNHTKAPYGFMVEFGARAGKMPARSFIGKALKEHGDDAAAAMKNKFIELIK